MIKPTVSERRKGGLPFPGVILRIVVSRVANSISFSNTFLSELSEKKSNIQFITVDFPALVYPTRATCGRPDCSLLLRVTLRSLVTVSNACRNWEMRFSI